jgi:hypothetical protein
MEAVFTAGLPVRITKADFRRQFLASFPKLTDVGYDDLIDDAISNVYAIFTGVGTIWEGKDRQVWFEKTQTCYRYLTAWYIADLYPTLVAGVPVMGPIPLKRKKVGAVDITYREDSVAARGYLDLLSGLKSNPFGGKAYLMITTSAARARLRNGRFV